MVKDAGVDTWSVCWYLEPDSPATRALEHLATEPAPRSKLIPGAVAGHRVGWFPGSRLLFAEGHPAGDRLGRPDDLARSFEQLVEGIGDRGIPIPDRRLADGRQASGFAGVRRLDSTVDLRVPDGPTGLAILTGVASLPMPRMKTKAMWEGKKIETVWFHGHGGKRVLGRWYDKGIESGGADRGLWIRPEDQRRFGSSGRLTLESVTSGSLARDAFVRRFQPLWKAAQGVTVAGPVELARKLKRLQEEGVITPGEAKRIAGHLLLASADAHLQAASTVRGDAAAARRNGLVLADGIFDHVEVDLGEVCERVLDEGNWGQG